MIGDILQPTHLLFVLVVALIVLGPKRLPEVGKSLGRGLRDFKTALGGEESDGDRPNQVVTTHPAPAPAQPAVHTEPPVHTEPSAAAEPGAPAEHASSPEPAEHVSSR